MRGPTFMAVEKVVDIRHASTAAECRAPSCTRAPVYEFSVVIHGKTQPVLTCRHHGEGPPPVKLALPEATKIIWIDETDAYLACGWHYKAKKDDRYTGDRTKPKQVELQTHLEDRLGHGGVCEFCRCDISSDIDADATEDEETEILAADGGTIIDDGQSPPMPAKGFDQSAVDETECAYCGKEFDNKVDRTSHQTGSRCIIAKLDYSPTEVREIADEASTLYEIQQEFRLGREQSRRLLRGAGCYEQFKAYSRTMIRDADTDADEEGD